MLGKIFVVVIAVLADVGTSKTESRAQIVALLRNKYHEQLPLLVGERRVSKRVVLGHRFCALPLEVGSEGIRFVLVVVKKPLHFQRIAVPVDVGLGVTLFQVPRLALRVDDVVISQLKDAVALAAFKHGLRAVVIVGVIASAAEMLLRSDYLIA